MNIANRLTILRMIMIPFFVVLMSWQPEWGTVSFIGSEIAVYQLIAAILFVLASFTDYLDGYLARKHNLVTAFGEFFDPMADKLLVISALILLIESGDVPAWAVIIIVARELLITGVRVLLARRDGTVLAAQMPGKIKTVTQMLAIILYLFNNAGFNWLPFNLADTMMYISVFFTIYSGADYLWQARFVFNED